MTASMLKHFSLSFALTLIGNVLTFSGGANTGDLNLMSGVKAVAPPSNVASATLEQGAARSPVELRAMTPALPAISEDSTNAFRASARKAHQLATLGAKCGALLRPALANPAPARRDQARVQAKMLPVP